MARRATIVQVFVGSPSDVQPERDILESVLNELNRSWSTTLGVVFELLRWETHVRPGVGSDPQAIINAQIGDGYDVFIGILWGRFGTPTPRAESGTVEEFERAYRRATIEQNGPEVMFYFKDAPLSPSKIDLVQLKKVQDFRLSLTERGGLYALFDDEESFQSSLRAHLSAIAQRFANASSAASVATTGVTAPALSIGDDDDLGYLDYLETYQSRMDEMTAALGTIAEATIRIGQQTHQRVDEINSLGGIPADTGAARRVIKKSADDMNAYAAILERHLPLMSSSRHAALGALSRALALHNDFSETEDPSLPALRDTLVSLRASAAESTESLKGFRNTVHGLPRMTGDLNRAKRAVVGQLDAVLTEIDTTTQTIDNIVTSIDRRLHRP